MGRRTTSTTKGGRFMNPADQERKMARKKELKKNKKQRHMVRAAVLKSKDPSDLLVQMEKLDEMEFSDFDAQPLSERVIQEKRTKLRETFVRVLGMYKRENEPEKFGELKKQLQAYDHKRLQLQNQFIAQKFAREVNPSEIPLPDSAPPPPEAGAAMTPAAALASRGLPTQPGQPFPPHLMMADFGSFMQAGFDFASQSMGRSGLGTEPLHGILKKGKKRSTYAPGPPVGPPPELSDSSDDEYRQRPPRNERSVRPEVDHHRESREDEEGQGEDEGEDADDYRARKRSYEDHAEEENEEEYDEEGNLVESRSTRIRFNDDGDEEDGVEKDSRTKYKEMAKMIDRGEMLSQQMTEGGGQFIGNRSGACIPPPPSLAMVSRGGTGGPPRLMRPPIPLPGLGSLRPGMRMPPPPPPGFPRGQRPPNYVGHVSGATTSVAAVLSAPPSINKPKQANPGAIIEAKPQLRNMQQEVTKLVPTAVKIRREQHAAITQAQKKPKGPLIFRTPETKISVPGSSVQHTPQKSSDEAYDEFMKELKTLL